MDHAIETERLTCRYGRTRAVADLTMHVPTGSIYALLGPNGAGKTTTLKTLMNLRPPASGVARVLGVDSRALGPADLARIGYVSENQRIPSNLTIGEIEAFCRPWYPTWDAALATELRERFGLDPRARIKSLSRGTRLKVQCLLALAPRPRLLILDEPFSGLDPVVRDDLTTGVLSLADRDGWSVLLTSHEMDDVERLADHVGFLANGSLLVEEPMQTLLARFRQVEVALADGAAMPDAATDVVARLRGRRARRALRRVAGLARRRSRAGATRSPARRSTRGRCRCARCSSRSRDRRPRPAAGAAR